MPAIDHKAERAKDVENIKNSAHPRKVVVAVDRRTANGVAARTSQSASTIPIKKRLPAEKTCFGLTARWMNSRA